CWPCRLTLCFFYLYAELRDLRSFPTRRSSDLGKPVWLLHGFPECWYAWHLQIEALAAAGYRVFAPEMRGYGASSAPADPTAYDQDRKSTRLNSSHVKISYAVFCLKKKKKHARL